LRPRQWRGCRTASQCHAAIYRDDDQWIVEDLGSRNGTRVNGIRVARRARIAPGDVLGFGAATARFDPDERRLFSDLRVEEPTGEASKPLLGEGLGLLDAREQLVVQG
jgi:pSer/pThr/pTyr-binding forkhead associated (FHA) protein